MSANKKMILRVQSSEGTKRIAVSESDATTALFEKVQEAFEVIHFGFTLYKDRSHKQEIFSSTTKSLKECKLQNGDMIYFSPVNSATMFDQPSKAVEKLENILPPTMGGGKKPQEDDVDVQLFQEDGKIPRARDDKFCRHKSNGSCVHCTPIEPYDEAYLKEQNVKNMSFHSYLRKLASAAGTGQGVVLDDVSYKIKPGCKEHPPWPRGICSKCQPSAVTLNRQRYRHVDNIMFENRQIVERFLGSWRATGNQSVGILYGRYERHPDVPLDEKIKVVDEIARKLGLTQVGWIFTDLLSEDITQGTVQHIRGVDSHFLAAQECIMAGYFQNSHPNACRYSTSGFFGSKFVTVCVTGDSSKQVHMEGYQVSEQCAALVRDGCLLPTRDAPELGYVTPSGIRQYVPDVFYKERDQYGNEIQAIARPLPVAYLLVDIPAGLAPPGSDTFNPNSSFQTAQRPVADHVQDLEALGDHTRASSDILQTLSDLHVLVYLATNDVLPIQMEELEPALQAVANASLQQAKRWEATCEAWATLQQIIPAHNNESEDMDTPVGAEWICSHCTYHNPVNHSSCEMCTIPRM